MSPAGWYPDPWQPTRWRYFDGAAWTGWVHPPAPQQPAPPSPGFARETAADSPADHFHSDPLGSGSPGRGSNRSSINSSPAAWWWAGSSLGVALIAFLALAWLVNR